MYTVKIKIHKIYGKKLAAVFLLNSTVKNKVNNIWGFTVLT